MALSRKQTSKLSAPDLSGTLITIIPFSIKVDY